MLLALIVQILAPAGDLEAAETKAAQALREGNVAAALGAYEEAIRAAPDTPTKLRLRDLYRAAGSAEPRPQSAPEEAQLEAHVREEKLRECDR